MIPLSIFLIIWLVLLFIFFIMSSVSIMQMLRFGISGGMVYYSTATFLIVAALIILATALYLTGADWTLGLDLGFSESSPISPY